MACLALKTASASAAAQASAASDVPCFCSGALLKPRFTPVLHPAPKICTQLHRAASALQAKVVLHVCRHSAAYLELLLPHASDPRVAALLSTLAACGCEEEAGVLADSSSAQSYLWLLLALAERLRTSAAVGGLSEEQAGLLAAALTSAVHALAAVEGELRQTLAQRLSQIKRGKKLSPEQLEVQVEEAVRCGS